ncbi:MAG: PD40 domain-containing protein [Caldilineaceae bacterium]|nr:PD40 domain-containing protein [Caldilineaceae bacterium]
MKSQTKLFLIIVAFLSITGAVLAAILPGGRTLIAQDGAVPTPFVVTATPTPRDVFEAATREAELADLISTVGTPTPVPLNWVLATNTPTPWVVTATPTAGNAATAAVMIAQETAIAYTTGTPDPARIVITSTPRPGRPLPTWTPMAVAFDDITATPVPVNAQMPAAFVGKIMFLSDVFTGNPRRPDAFIMNPDGTGLAKLTSRELYDQAKERDHYSADGRYYAHSQKEQSGSKRTQIFYDDYVLGSKKQLTYFGAGVSWDAAWSPVEDLIAFISNESKNDEIWTARPGQQPAKQLTNNSWEWDKGPSFSPDGQQIIFMSNRTGRQQIWIMNKDGGNQHQLIDLPFEAWDPVWVKYGE